MIKAHAAISLPGPEQAHVEQSSRSCRKEFALHTSLWLEVALLDGEEVVGN